jgi:DNA-binding transcriptional LysR family regulator
MDWEDLRHFLAVARSGSTLVAARTLRVSQTTTARRIAALEAALGLALFERRPAGYRLTSTGAALLPHAEAVERAALGLEESAATARREAGGVVRLTATDILAATVLAPLLGELHDAHPAIRIELDTSDKLRDLAAGEAEVAIRLWQNPTGAGLVARRIADDRWTVYCSRTYAERHGLPRRRRELAGHVFIGGGGPGVWKVYREWLVANGLEDAVAFHHSSSVGLLAAVRAGAGLAALPCIVAENEPDLIRCLPSRDETRGIWLLTHERYRHEPRVRAVMDFLAPRLVALGRAGA